MPIGKNRASRSSRRGSTKTTRTATGSGTTAAYRRRSGVRKLTAVDLQRVRELAERLGRLIPLTGYRGKFNLSTIARERKLDRLLSSKHANKKEAFYEFLRVLLVEHPRTLKLIIREALPKAIERRHKQGDPVLEGEAHGLAACLKAVGVDLVDEIADLHLPKERPQIVPPPPEVQRALTTVGLHARLHPDCTKLFLEGHVNEATRKALERFEKHVQERSGITDKIGAELMSAAFGGSNAKLRLSTAAGYTDPVHQQGLCHLAMGVMKWWRNELSHGDTPPLAHHEALARLLLVSSLLHIS